MGKDYLVRAYSPHSLETKVQGIHPVHKFIKEEQMKGKGEVDDKADTVDLRPMLQARC
jgi:hypothetical protein